MPPVGSVNSSPMDSSHQVMSMSAASKTSGPATSLATRNATSSQASPDGRSPCEWRAGTTLDLFGPAPALANLSARQARARGFLTSGTYGRPSSISSSSAALQSSMESRLQSVLDSNGSTVFSMTWRRSTTPAGRPIFRLVASRRPTSDSASTGWLPTPRASMGTHMITWARAITGEHRSQLEDYLAWLYMEAGGQRMRAVNVCPRLCQTMMGYPRSWLDSAMRLFRPSPPDSSPQRCEPAELSLT